MTSSRILCGRMETQSGLWFVCHLLTGLYIITQVSGVTLKKDRSTTGNKKQKLIMQRINAQYIKY